MRGLRVGILGPNSPFGSAVRECLAEGSVPVIELKLFEPELTGEASLTQFGDEIVVTQPLDSDLLPRLDVLFIGGEGGGSFNRIAREAARSGVLTIVQGAVGLDGSVIAPGFSKSLEGELLAIVPRPESFFLGVTLERLARERDLEAAVATILVPAQASGAAGADELHQQVVNLLNFRAVPTEVLREQLAFNVTLSGQADMAEAVRFEAGCVAGGEANVTVNLVRVPVFHGYSISLWVRLSEAVEAKSLEAAFRGSPFASDKTRRTEKLPSPVSVAESDRIHVRVLPASSNDASRELWLWVVADSSVYAPAATAVELAREILS
ncbi:MAG TPA: Asd/ArgC dimerization domain-containing protein [Vicinamibacteria bacterium]|nr:Asd/ArgC dimerization domain-containing protein [Vicinamibacteria bacterium]